MPIKTKAAAKKPRVSALPKAKAKARTKAGAAKTRAATSSQKTGADGARAGKPLLKKTSPKKTSANKASANKTSAGKAPANAARSGKSGSVAKLSGAGRKSAARAAKTAPKATPKSPPKKARTPTAGKSARRASSLQTVETRLSELRGRLLEINDLGHTAAVLNWDQATYMPPGGAEARGRQGAMLCKLAHERSVDPALGRLLEGLARDAGKLPPDGDDANLIRVARREFEKAIRVPGSYVERSSALGSAAYMAWTKARPANDFNAVRPYLEKTVDLSREYASYFPHQRIADPMIDDCDAGMTTSSVQTLFAALRRELAPIVHAICDQPPADDSCLRGAFREGDQLDFSVAVARRLGYDFERGRIDKTHHPFCTTFSDGDVRITTRFNENDIGEALFSTIHEAGHAMYEQGVAAALAGTPLGGGASAGVHESQSRLWENIVGRSRGFWRHFYPALQETFPDAFRTVPAEAFYRAINKVQRSLIRTDADEVTYNLHVMMRFDIELDLLEGRLEVKDLPDAWRARIAADLGIAPEDDRNGCMQDVHWFNGGVGGCFQGYTIGNILSAQFYAAAVKARPEIPDEVARGEFSALHRWLVDNIYRHGRKFDPDGLVLRATGSPMTIEPYVAYLRSKYGELYRLPGDAGLGNATPAAES